MKVVVLAAAIGPTTGGAGHSEQQVLPHLLPILQAAATDYSPPQSFAVFPSYQQPRCLLPLGDTRWTLNGLSMVRLHAWRWRILKALLAGLVKTGWKGWARERIFVARDQLRPLESIVGAVTGETKPVFAMLVGVPGLYRKLIVQVMSPDGKILCYVKLPLTEAAGGHLQHEAEVLHRLGAVAALRGHIPEVLHSQEWQEGYILFQSPGSGKRGPPRFTRGHERFLRRLWDVHPVQKPGQVLVDEVGQAVAAGRPLAHPRATTFRGACPPAGRQAA